MGSPRLLLARVALLLPLQWVSAQIITRCPTAGSSYTATEGVDYAICPSTDFEGRSTQVINNIADVAPCAQICSTDPACLKAVYDPAQKVCHIKDDTQKALVWVRNSRFSAIYINNSLAEATPIARCPYVETSTTLDRIEYRTCGNTEIRGASVEKVANVASAAACAQTCSTRNGGCDAAVYDKQDKACHIKADAASNTLVWYTNKRYDVIRRAAAPSPAAVGSWSDLVRLPVVPVAAYVVPAVPESSRVMFWSSWGTDTFGGAGGMTQFADYNYQTGSVSARNVTDTRHDMFCPAISSLQDGRIIISGGGNAEATTFFDPRTNAFERGPDLVTPRGYHVSVTTSEGKVFAIGGAYSGTLVSKDGELFDPVKNTWTALPGALVGPMLTTDAEGVWRTDNHAWLVSWVNASVFQDGPSRHQNWYGTTGAGSVTAAGVRDAQDAMCGVFVMYEPGKILSAGGSQSYTDSPATAKAHITTITVPGQPATVEEVAPMAYPRGFANVVVLPNGQALVTGGQKRSLVFTDTDGVLYAELFDPVTKTWATMAPEAVPRNYHSVSLLLPDATVWSGGGGLCPGGWCDPEVNHADGQIFSPPYLFDTAGQLAARPVIAPLSATTVQVGGQLRVTVDTAAASLVLVRMGSATHSVNSDQRRVPLTNVTFRGSDLHTQIATLPADSGILIPGYYYLFAMDRAGVPSIAKTVQIVL